MTYITKMLSPDKAGITEAAELLKKGEAVAVPTETVYGLAANALEGDAVKKIFEAKGRPADNPLIVHIAEVVDIYKYAEEIPANALRLAEHFCPGPLTMVLKKKDIIPHITSGGLDTAGFRIPASITARAIIKEAGFPLAAPSANISGSPSPTSAQHVFDDMNGRIPAIVDGGKCAVGVESTVISFDGEERAVILRPGFVTPADIGGVIGEENVICAKGVTEKINDSEQVLSPGMKYKHYAPLADIAIIDADEEDFAEYVSRRGGENVGALIFGAEAEKIKCGYIVLGDTPDEQARRLFSALRELDGAGYKRVYARCPQKNGVGLAVYNRLLRAAGFEVISL